MEPTTKARVGPNVHLIGHGYHEEETITAVVVGTADDAEAIADAQTLAGARAAVDLNVDTTTVVRYLQSVPLLTADPASTDVAAPVRVTTAFRPDIVGAAFLDSLPVGSCIIRVGPATTGQRMGYPIIRSGDGDWYSASAGDAGPQHHTILQGVSYRVLHHGGG